MITFYHAKQGRLLNVGQFRIYNVEVDQEGRANIVANMLGRLTKSTTKNCLHMMIVD